MQFKKKINRTKYTLLRKYRENFSRYPTLVQLPLWIIRFQLCLKNPKLTVWAHWTYKLSRDYFATVFRTVWTVLHKWKITSRDLNSRRVIQNRKAFVERIVVFIADLENTELWKIQNQLLQLSVYFTICMPSYPYGFKIVCSKYFKTCFNKVFYIFKIEYFFTGRKK